jgi:hypothetical protein
MKKYLIAYAVVGLITFGYSFNVDYRHPVKYDMTEANVISAMFAGTLWPLYWSVQAFRGLRKEAP